MYIIWYTYIIEINCNQSECTVYYTVYIHYRNKLQSKVNEIRISLVVVIQHYMLCIHLYVNLELYQNFS